MRYLFLSPHPDDVELACGGTIAKLKGEIYITVFSDCGIDMLEVEKAHRLLKAETVLYKFPRRAFHEHRNEIRETIYNLKDLQPDVVFIPVDNHQDHEVISQEAQRVFKDCTLIGYAHPHNLTNSGLNYFIELKPYHVALKMKVLKHYKSQTGRKYFDPKSIKANLIYYGGMAAMKYAEAFYIIRLRS